jgi:hypothetical protein
MVAIRFSSDGQFGWKYRRHLWKHRRLIRHRKQIAGAAVGMAGIGAIVLFRGHSKTVS